MPRESLSRRHATSFVQENVRLHSKSRRRPAGSMNKPKGREPETQLRTYSSPHHLLPKASSLLRIGLSSVEGSSLARVDVHMLRDVFYAPEVAVINDPCVQL